MTEYAVFRLLYIKQIILVPDYKFDFINEIINLAPVSTLSKKVTVIKVTTETLARVYDMYVEMCTSV